MSKAKVYEKKITIPTYGVGEPEKTPMFFEKRVYQGSCGKVYPNAVIEKICNDKADKQYTAVILENDWLYVVVLPELGGRIYTAYDKTNGYDFIYHNKVIKPALVGLLGPWISGGIEFNWPQHHRPTTYMPANFEIAEKCGSVSVFVGETEGMFGLKHTTEIKLFDNKSYIEISTAVYNGGELPETFLWWANPAYKVNDSTITVMPHDVTAVMDHGKRAVSAFPIAKGEYYKMDYSSGVDISQYKNIPVPTSFMAYKSEFDFVGGYDYSKNAGLLHVADHHISPGKKQWTWGCGDFGKAWDRNLTDEDGPYVELMTGCFTDNQPDFTFIQPHETKTFTQYFMPYHNVGKILNADENICFGAENGILTIYSSAEITCFVTVAEGGKVIYDGELKLAPTEVAAPCSAGENADITLKYADRELSFHPSELKSFDIPQPASACPEPRECATCEELYLYGTHIEQYRHATRLPEDYYIEGLRRDPTDMRLNNAYGLLLMRLGRVNDSIPYLKVAIEKSCIKNTNPKDTEAYYNKGVAHFYLGEYKEAYDLFYKCVWGNNKASAYFFLALIDKHNGNLNAAIEHIENSIIVGGNDAKAIDFLGRLYKMQGNKVECGKCFMHALAVDKLDVAARYELGEKDFLSKISAAEIRKVASEYFDEEQFAQSEALLTAWISCAAKGADKNSELGSEKLASGKNSNEAEKNSNCAKLDYMTSAYLVYSKLKQGKSSDGYLKNEVFAVSFANSLCDLKVLNYIAEKEADFAVFYQLGNLHYDKRNYKLAASNWEQSEKLNNAFPTVKRNLALYFYNKVGDKHRALEYMESAFALERADGRILLELFQLYALCGKTDEERFKLLSENLTAVETRDDLYLEYLSLLEARGEHKAAYEKLMLRKFHPWEGGEGKVPKLYKRILKSLSQIEADGGNYDAARELLEKSFVMPQNFGEGKLILDLDNDVWFFLGELAERFAVCAATENPAKVTAHGATKIHDAATFKSDAQKFYTMASRGKADVADDMYYNDNPIEYVYYMALAFKKLGDFAAAEKIKTAFANYYEKHIHTKAVIDYFAVSLPDMLIWEQDIDEKNREFCEKIKQMSEEI